GEGRDGEEAIEQAWEHAAPAVSLEAVIGDDHALVRGTCAQRRQPARRAAHMMRMDEVGSGQGCQQARRQGMGRVASQVAERSEGSAAEAAGLAKRAGAAAEADQFAVELLGQRAGQLEREALAAAEQAVWPEGSRGNLDDAHAASRLADPGRPGPPDRWLPLPPPHGRSSPTI